MASPTLIYCGGGNPRFAAIALEHGFRYGAQVPGSVYYPLHFADQDWKRPDRTSYMKALSLHRPQMATVLDWEREEQLSEVLSWAEEAAQYAGAVVIIPKVLDQTHRIPCEIGGKPVILGFSVPSRYGGTSVPVWEFTGRRLHLLGGSPQRQMQEWMYLSCVSDVVSADGNMAMKMASRYNRFWHSNVARKGYWSPTLRTDGTAWGEDAPYEAFRRSCLHIQQAWQRGAR